MYITIFACCVGLWMMVNRFGLSVKELLSFAVISLVLLGVIVAVAAIAGLVLRKILKNK